MIGPHENKINTHVKKEREEKKNRSEKAERMRNMKIIGTHSEIISHDKLIYCMTA